MSLSESLPPSLDPAIAAAGGANAESARPRLVAGWLLACCALVFAMIILGGVTRLTGSGLSIVDWDPIMGVVPPLTEQQWASTFDKYRQFPEYQQKNIGMTLPEFKSIFWFEYAHRLLGRLIGVVFLVPFLYFWARGYFSRRMVPKLATMFVLGALQGLLGWYMVMSGLVDRPHVSQYRLTAHLGAALVIYAYMLWVAMGLLFPQRQNSEAGMGRAGFGIATFVFVTALSGGFVAGLKAGLAYNTFPLMGGEWFPAAYWTFEPAWINLFENIAAVQFNHRILAELVFVAVVAFWWVGRRRRIPDRARLGLNLMAAMVVLQVALGIATLLLAVPVSLGALHQAGALVLFTFALFTAHGLRVP